MKLTCSICGKTYKVSDELVGKKVRCLECKAIMIVQPAADPAMPSAGPLAAPAAPAAPPCPGCGKPLAADAVVCMNCGFNRQTGSKLELRLEPAVTEPPPVPAFDYSHVQGAKCFVAQGGDMDGAVSATFQRFRNVIADEQLLHKVIDLPVRDGAVPPLSQEDIYVFGEVGEHDYGSRAIRYFLTPLSLLGGIGACKLTVSGHFQLGTAPPETFVLSARQGIGVFGGSGDRLMAVNVKSVGRRLAAKVVRKLTGRRLLNTTAYECALVSFVLGFCALIPGIGFAIAIPGVICGLIATITILARKLQKRRTMAIAGLALNLVCPWLFVLIILLGK